jgi:hypothetical protein
MLRSSQQQQGAQPVNSAFSLRALAAGMFQRPLYLGHGNAAKRTAIRAGCSKKSSGNEQDAGPPAVRCTCAPLSFGFCVGAPEQAQYVSLADKGLNPQNWSMAGSFQIVQGSRTDNGGRIQI